VSEEPAETGPSGQDDVREEMVQKLLKGFHENQGAAAMGDFIGAEFQHDPPTDAERAEAHRRYVDELAERGLSELGDAEN
jgi:hypothetical protein